MYWVCFKSFIPTSEILKVPENQLLLILKVNDSLMSKTTTTTNPEMLLLGFQNADKRKKLLQCITQIHWWFFVLILISLLSRKTHEMVYSYHLVLIKMGCCGIF